MILLNVIMWFSLFCNIVTVPSTENSDNEGWAAHWSVMNNLKLTLSHKLVDWLNANAYVLFVLLRYNHHVIFILAFAFVIKMLCNLLFFNFKSSCYVLNEIFYYWLINLLFYYWLIDLINSKIKQSLKLCISWNNKLFNLV